MLLMIIDKDGKPTTLPVEDAKVDSLTLKAYTDMIFALTKEFSIFKENERRVRERYEKRLAEQDAAFRRREEEILEIWGLLK